MKAAALMNTVKQPTDCVCVNARVGAHTCTRKESKQNHSVCLFACLFLEASVEYVLNNMIWIQELIFLFFSPVNMRIVFKIPS